MALHFDLTLLSMHTGEALQISLYKYNDNKGFSIYLFYNLLLFYE